MLFRVRDFLLTVEEAPMGLLVVKRLGIVHSNVIATTGFFKDFMAGLRDIISSRWTGYRKEIDRAIALCLEEVVEQTEKAGGNAVIGVKINVRPMFTEKTKMFFVSVQGTACLVEKNDQ